MKKFFVILILLALAGGGYWWFTRSADSGEIKVLDTATLERGSVREVLQATGIVKTQVGAEVKIGAQATGRINEMLVRVGDAVTAGQLIAVIDDRELLARQREVEAQLQRLQAELARIERVYPLSISEARADVQASEARAEFARIKLARQKKLFLDRTVAEQDLDQAQEDAEVTTNDLTVQRATLERLQAEFDQERNKAQKSIQETEASLESISVRISYTRIFSPIDGLVSQVAAQEGETVVAGLQVANLVTVVDPSRLEMWIYVDETDVGRMRPGLPVEFSVDAYPDRTYETTIKQIYPKPEIRDNIVYYQALCPITREQAETLRPEMTTQCTIVVREKDDVLALPNAALKWVGDGQFVFVQQPDGSVTRVQPELGLNGLTTSEVLSGLNAGDVVATQLVLPASETAGKGGGRGGS